MAPQKRDSTFIVLITIVIITTVYITIQVYRKIFKTGGDCKYKSEKNTKIKSVYNFDYNKPLTNYYIKTAYNCCSLSDNWVNMCALEYTIKQGCRCLDFEIYDVNGEPAIGTTLTKNGTSKDSYNHIGFDDMLKKVFMMGFSSRYVDCYEDPLILNFRIKARSVDIYNKMAYYLNKYKDKGKYLDSTYNYYSREKIDFDFDGITSISTLIEQATEERDNAFDAAVEAAEPANEAAAVAAAPTVVAAQAELNRLLNIGGSNTLTANISDLKDRLIIMISDCDISIMTSDECLLKEHVNILGARATLFGGAACGLGSGDTAGDITEINGNLIQINNSHVLDDANIIQDISLNITSNDYLVIMIPDDLKNRNTNYCYHKKQGIQMIGMLFQKNVPSKFKLEQDAKDGGWWEKEMSPDTDFGALEVRGSLDGYNKWFDDNGTAFIHKNHDVHEDGELFDENTCGKVGGNGTTTSGEDDDNDDDGNSFMSWLQSFIPGIKLNIKMLSM